MNNRMHNSTNPYQGDAKKVLCACSAGLLRSPTAAVVLNREYGYNTRACGIEPSFALIPFDEVLAHWADEIVVMESYQIGAVPLSYRDKVQCLDITDSFGYMDERLQQMILENYQFNGTTVNEETHSILTITEANDE